VADWQVSKKNLKNYPHFDPVISAKNATSYALDVDRVEQHAFHPFIRYVERWTKFAKKGKSGKSKSRPIRYASRRDAYVFSRYRHLLSELYEVDLAQRSLAGSILAYRKIPGKPGEGGKCNIHFALDAFLKVKELGNCCVIALDISAYFESLDHKRLYDLWSRLLNTKRLPKDHFKVFTAITKYAFVDKEKVYERLGHYGPKRMSKKGGVINGYLTPYRDVPKRLCDGSTFRKEIAGDGTKRSIIEKNYKSYGIPQGAPISDLLANLYLLDFDAEINAIAMAMGGAYYRYSDDILVIVPCEAVAATKLEQAIRQAVSKYGEKLLIKEEKSSIVAFKMVGDVQRSEMVLAPRKDDDDENDDLAKTPKAPRTDGMEYLGFRFDGRKIYIRDRTLQGLYRKITLAARREASALAKRYPNRNETQLASNFDREAFIQKFGRVREFGEKQDDYRNWTFWTYSNRAATVFGPLGSTVRRQLRNYRDIISHKIDKEISRAVARRDHPSNAGTRFLVKKAKKS
jgi:hypothetical protein